jgi:hypothetical protein
MSPTTKNTTTQTTTAPIKSNQTQITQIPKTPSITPHDDFNLTPNTQTTHSFADSGFFSSPDGTYRPTTNYKDWILFPDVEEDGDFAENGFLDTSGFFKDADEVVNYSDTEYDNYEDSAATEPSPDSSLELPPLNKSLNPAYENELRTLTRSLEHNSISSLPTPPSPSNFSESTYFSIASNGNEEKEDISMLEIWQKSQERSERIAYQFEQPPYAQREHLLPAFRQASRVRRRSGNANVRRLKRSVGQLSL